jgi:hypothetical protein
VISRPSSSLPSLIRSSGASATGGVTAPGAFSAAGPHWPTRLANDCTGSLVEPGSAFLAGSGFGVIQVNTMKIAAAITTNRRMRLP